MRARKGAPMASAKRHRANGRSGERPARPYVGDYGSPVESAGAKAGAGLGMVLLAIVAGFCVGFVVWAAFRLSSLLTELVWDGAVASIAAELASAGIAAWWLPVAVCTLGGLIIGLWSRFVGGDPDALETVMGDIKRTGEYRVDGFGRGVVGFVLPLAFGGSIGPEAGLTGLIASAVCWLGRTLRAAGLRVKGIADVTVSAALSAIFATPLLGIVAVVQDAMPAREPDGGADAETAARHVGAEADGCDGAQKAGAAPRSEGAAVSPHPDPNPLSYDFRLWAKVVLYAAAAFGAVAGMSCVGSIFGAEAGLPRFDGADPGVVELVWFVPCVAIGYAGAFLYHAGNRAFGALGAKLERHRVARPLIGGVALGVAGAALPYVMFPGEAQTHELMAAWGGMGAGVLVATGLAKCLVTPWCLNMGWRGGHFFPCIFAGIACGYGVAAAAGADPMFCVAVSTASLVAGVQRKPFVALALLLLCFPASSIVWMGLACLVGAAIPLPRAIVANAGKDAGGTAAGDGARVGSAGVERGDAVATPDVETRASAAASAPSHLPDDPKEG